MGAGIPDARDHALSALEAAACSPAAFAALPVRGLARHWSHCFGIGAIGPCRGGAIKCHALFRGVGSRPHLSHKMFSLIGFRKSTPPQNGLLSFSNGQLLFTITNKHIKLTICGGVDILLLINEYIVSSKHGGLRDFRWCNFFNIT